MSSDEFARIARIRQAIERKRPDIVVNIGDDAAVVAPGDGHSVLSVDAAVEGTHFRLDWMSFREIGFRAVVAAVSDLAAMGATPRCALLSLVLPRDLTDPDLDSLIEGVAAAADDYDMAVVGGNMATGREISITTTVMGEVDRALTRSGARPGDGLYVTGVVGARALGLAMRLSGQEASGHRADFDRAWKLPTAQVQVGRRLHEFATACIDISDGLLQDLGHVCEASGVGARVHTAELPFAPNYVDVCRDLGHDPTDLALTGGEDYELLFAAPASVSVSDLATRIGQFTDLPGAVEAIDEDGRILDLGSRGFDHFAGR